MKYVLALAIVGYGLYSVFSTGKDVQDTAKMVKELREGKAEAQRIASILKPCKEDVFEFCADKIMPQEIAACLERSSVSESCSEALRKLHEK